MPQAAVRELTDENIFQLLSQGSLILMEDDLRKLQGEQAQVVKEKRIRGRLKITPKERAQVPTAVSRRGFFSSIKERFGLGKKRPEALPPVEVVQEAPSPAPPPAFSSSEIKTGPVVRKKELASGLRLGEKILEPIEEEIQPTPLETRPLTGPSQASQSITAPPTPSVPAVAAQPVKEAPSVAPASVAPFVLPEDFKAEPFAIDDLQEMTKEKSRLEQERGDLDAKLQVFWPQRRPLELKVKVLQEDKQALTKSLSPFAVKEAQLRTQQKEIAEKEKKAQLSEERHQLEEQRWNIEKQLREIEKQKWAQEERVEAKNAEIKAAELQLQGVLAQEGALREQKEVVVEKLEKISLAQERLMLGDKVIGVDLQRKNLKKEILAQATNEAALNKELAALSEQERAVEQQTNSLGASLEKAASFKERKEIEERRWQADEQRRNIEQKRWEIEKKIERAKEEAGIIKRAYEEILNKQVAIEIRADEIDILLRLPFAQAEQILTERNKQKEAVEAAKKQEIEIRSEQIKPLLPVLEVPKKRAAQEPVPIQPGGRMKPPPQEKISTAGIGEKAGLPGEEFTSVGEAETAAKIQQKVAEREREKKLALIQQKAEFQRESTVVPKIKGPVSKADVLLKLSQISPEEQVGRERFLARLAGKTPSFAVRPERNGKDIVFRPLVKKSSFFEKILARIFFLLIIFATIIAIGVLLYFYVLMPRPKVYPSVSPVMPGGVQMATTVPSAGGIATSAPAIAPTSTLPFSTTTPEPEMPTSTLPTSTQPVMPESLIKVGTTTVFEVAPTTSIADLLKTALQNNQGGLNEIVFRTADNFLLGLNGILTIMWSPWPENVSQQLAGGGTLLVSGQGPTSRLGFIEQVKDGPALATAMKAWEPNMETDWAVLWGALGKTKPAVVRYFRSALYKGVTFRYQTFTKQDFGICYAVIDNYFVLTTSYAQMKLVLDQLKSP